MRVPGCAGLGVGGLSRRAAKERVDGPSGPALLGPACAPPPPEPDRGNGQLPGQAAGAELGWGWRSDRSGPLGLEASGNLAFAAAVASADFVHPGRFMELGRVPLNIRFRHS